MFVLIVVLFAEVCVLVVLTIQARLYIMQISDGKRVDKNSECAKLVHARYDHDGSFCHQ